MQLQHKHFCPFTYQKSYYAIVSIHLCPPAFVSQYLSWIRFSAACSVLSVFWVPITALSVRHEFHNSAATLWTKVLTGFINICWIILPLKRPSLSTLKPFRVWSSRMSSMVVKVVDERDDHPYNINGLRRSLFSHVLLWKNPYMSYMTTFKGWDQILSKHFPIMTHVFTHRFVLSF